MATEPQTIVFSPYPYGRPAHFQPATPATSVSADIPDPAKLAELMAQDQRERESRQKWFIKGDFWTQEIVHECHEAGEPLRQVEVVNRVANRFKFKNWPEKLAKKKELLRLTTVMLRQGRLERVRRKWVRVPPPGKDHKFRTWVASMMKPLELPKPNI